MSKNRRSYFFSDDMIEFIDKSSGDEGTKTDVITFSIKSLSEIDRKELSEVSQALGVNESRLLKILFDDFKSKSSPDRFAILANYYSKIMEDEKRKIMENEKRKL